MVNTNIQGVIPINGRGFVAKVKRNYQPGEYRRLSNCELLNGEIRPRRNIKSSFAPNAAVTPLTNSAPFLGVMYDHLITASVDEQRGTASLVGDNVTLWDPNLLPVPAAANSYHRIVGAFVYNSKYFWITDELDKAGGADTHRYCLYWRNADVTVESVTFASLTRTVIITETALQSHFRNFFIHKDRLFVILGNGVFCSKATDPTVFSVPNGAFFKFPEQIINYAISLRDTIFVLCEKAVFAINYSADPNTDSTVRQITGAVGGEHGCVYKDTPYFTNKLGIYAINGNSVDKVIDISSLTLGSPGNYKIVAWENYLVVNYAFFINYDSLIFDSDARLYFNHGRRFSPTVEAGDGADWLGYSSLGHNTFFINMDTGSIHTVDFLDSPDAVGNKGYIVDMMVSPSDVFGFAESNCLFFMTNKEVSHVGSVWTFHSNVYFMEPHQVNDVVKDTAVASAGSVKLFKPNIWVEVDGYTPDGNEYLVKKFRSIELMGNFPSSDFGANFAWDNKDYPVNPIDLNVDEVALEAAGETRPHHPARIGLNQRAKAISIQLKVKNPFVEIPQVPNELYAKYDEFFLSDMRVLWSYTNRGPVTKTPTLVT